MFEFLERELELATAAWHPFIVGAINFEDLKLFPGFTFTTVLIIMVSAPDKPFNPHGQEDFITDFSTLNRCLFVDEYVITIPSIVNISSAPEIHVNHLGTVPMVLTVASLSIRATEIPMAVILRKLITDAGVVVGLVSLFTKNEAHRSSMLN
jgi:hypothetical protein